MAYSPDGKPSVMGYPSANRYPQGPPVYPVPYQGGYVPPYPAGYPSAPSSKHYASPSFNVWYGQSHTYGQWAPEQNNAHKFGRLMLVTMITLLITMCMVSLVIWFLFGTEVPDFEVASFSVSNLNISETMVEANWEANVTVSNPNANLKVRSTSIKASIMYKDFPLAMSSLDPFYLEGNNEQGLYFKLEKEKAICKELLAAEIMKDQKVGVMLISLRLGLGAKFSSTTDWRKENLRVFCEDIKVVFTPNGTGRLAEDSPTECLIFT